MKHELDTFFNPKSVAIIGASRHPKKFGRVIFENFLRTEFKGKVFAVNPKGESILGERCYKTLSEIKENIDLAVVVIPAEHVPQSIKECTKKGVRSCIVISAGFSEIGNLKGEEEILKAKGKMRIIGPNVIGIYDAYSKVDTIFNPPHRQSRPEKGSIGFISQSGAFGASMMDWASAEGIGLSRFISIGNRIDVDEIDLLDYLMKDNQTKAIAIYLEGTRRGSELFKKLKEAVKKKPVIIIKAGQTTEGSHAASSHTGSLAGEAEVYSGVFKQAGAIEVKEIEDLFNISKALAFQPLPKGNRIHVITNGGGFGVLATDALIKNKLKLSELSQDTIEKIKDSKDVPNYAVIKNPMDLVGDATSARYKAAIGAVLEDKNVDGIIVTVLFQLALMESNVVDVIINADRKSDKPIIICSAGGAYTSVHKKILEESGIPTYNTPEQAAKAMKA
ncbi:MAG: CoA-binding protein, partial [Candidatus Aenigmatarchaeota archaeon]